MNDEEKRKYADFVIVNDGETPLIPQVLELIGSLSEKCTICYANRHLLNNKNKQAYFVLSSAYIIFAPRKK